jgi:hypothetical protein
VCSDFSSVCPDFWLSDTFRSLSKIKFHILPHLGAIV